MEYSPPPRTAEEIAKEQRALADAERLRSLAADFAFASPGRQILGTAPDKKILELERPALEQRGRVLFSVWRT